MILIYGDAKLRLEHIILNKKRNRAKIQLRLETIQLKSETMDVNPLLVLALGLVVVVMVYRYLRDTFSVLEKLNIPGPKPTWIFGNAKSFHNRNPLDVFMEWKKIYGKIYGFYEGFRAGIVINDPELAKIILSKRFDNFHLRTPYRPFQYYPSKLSVVNLDGDEWKHHRTMLNKVLNFGSNFQAVINKISNRTQVLTKTLDEKRHKTSGQFDITGTIDRYVTETILSVVANMSEDDILVHTDSLMEYQQAVKMSSAADNPICGLARLFPIVRPFLQMFDGKHRKLHEKTVDLLRSYLRRISQEKNNNDEETREHSSILSHLLSSKVSINDNDRGVTKRHLEEDEILAHVLAMFGETFETSANALLFVLYELALHPHVQDRIYNEIIEMYEHKEEEITYSKLQNLTYLDMVINEAYRLHPIAPGLSRMCVSDCNIEGIQIKKNMSVRLMTSTLYRDSDYFPRPEMFNPERFSPEAKQSRHPFTFLPFGQGPRQCPGQKLAMSEVKLAIIAVVKEFSLEVNEHTEVPLKTALRPSLCPANGVNLTLKKR